MTTKARIRGRCYVSLNEREAKCLIGVVMVKAAGAAMWSEAHWKTCAEDAVAISTCGEEKLCFCNRDRHPLSASSKRL